MLLGICDANYMFSCVDIGAYGRRSDGGIFRDSTIGRKFFTQQMSLPKSKPLTVDGEPMPYVLVGDEAFQLTEFLLRPYPGKGGLNDDRNVFNYRLSRARRTIENTFGIIVSQWRILKRPMNSNIDKTMNIVQAIVCLHNWIRKRDINVNEYVSESMVDRYTSDGFVPGDWRQATDDSSALQDTGNWGSNNHSRHALAIRDEFCRFFNGEGAVPWQFYCSE